MADKIKVDVAVNVYGKPYQTVLSILSLLKYSKNHINNIYIIILNINVKRICLNDSDCGGL